MDKALIVVQRQICIAGEHRTSFQEPRIQTTVHNTSVGRADQKDIEFVLCCCPNWKCFCTENGKIDWLEELFQHSTTTRRPTPRVSIIFEGWCHDMVVALGNLHVLGTSSFIIMRYVEPTISSQRSLSSKPTHGPIHVQWWMRHLDRYPQ